jgi:hypothetical protein
MRRACSTNGEKRRNMLSVGSAEGKRPLGGTKCRRVENIKMDLIWGCLHPVVRVISYDVGFK